MSAVLPVFEAGDDLAEIGAALDTAGCVVVTGLIDADARAAITADLAPGMETARVLDEDDPDEFYPARTRRMSALLARSEQVSEMLVPHETSMAMCDRFLLPNSEFGYQVHVSAALEVGPGAREQVLHREEDSFTYFPEPRPNLIVASMWAMSDFRADNGATLLVPGSHRWPAERKAEPQEILQAEMPAGGVLFWMGGTLHGAGANVSSDWRYGIILTYSLGWVRQEENQYMHITPERLEQMSPRVRELTGFPMYRALGFYDPRMKRA